MPLSSGNTYLERAGWRSVGCSVGLVALVTTAVVGCSGGGPAGPSSAATSAPSTATTSATRLAPTDPLAYAAEIVTETNAVRDREGLEPLAANDCAEVQAAARVGDLVGATALEHAPMAPVISACPPYSEAAENLSRAAAPPGDVMQAWLGSPGHKANLVDPELTQLGVACVVEPSPDVGGPDDQAQMLCSQIFLGG